MLLFTAREMQPQGASHQHISALTWRNTDTGHVGKSKVEDIIDWLDKGNRAYVSGGGATIDVLVRRPPGRRPHLETRPDWTGQDNLLSLPLG